MDETTPRSDLPREDPPREDRDWRLRTAVVLTEHGLPGVTFKVTIGGQDLYAKLAFLGERLVYLDLTLTAPRRQGGAESLQHVMDMTATTNNSRALIEMLCRHANELLQSGTWEAADLIEAWAGTRFDPSGWVRIPGEEAPVRCSSPMSAVAHMLRLHLSRWIAAAAQGWDHGRWV